MSITPNSRTSRPRQEEGFLLLGVLFMVLLVTMALAIAAPKMAESIRRDKEIETVHRGMQYARAIQIYFNKYGRYPNTIDQLVKSDNQRFLRRRYLNPMTGKDDWRIIHYGEAKVPPQGLFGQTVGQTGGITPTGATNGAGSTGIGGSSSPFDGSGSSGSGFGSSGSSLGSSGSMYSSGGSSPSSSGSGFGSSGSSFGAGSSTSPFGNNGSSTSPFSNSGSSTSATGGTDSGSGSGGTSTTGANGTTNNIGGTQTTGGSGSAFGSPGVSVGGAPIVGVGLLDKKTSIKIYKKQTHYNQWEFVYDPNQNTAIASGGTINGSGTSTGTGTTGSTGVNGGTSGGFSLGNGSGPGSNNESGFGSSNGSGFGGSNGSGFGGSSGSGFPNAPVNNSPQ
jgi:type II secretory pathway pseudopilin PulG